MQAVEFSLQHPGDILNDILVVKHLDALGEGVIADLIRALDVGSILSDSKKCHFFIKLWSQYNYVVMLENKKSRIIECFKMM